MSLFSCNLPSVLTPPSFIPSISFLKPKRGRTLSPLKPKFVMCSTTSPPEPEPITIESNLKETLNLRLKTIEVTKETLDDGKHRPLQSVGKFLAANWMAVVPALLMGVYFCRDYILTNSPAFLRFLTENAPGITVLITMAVILYGAFFSRPQVRNTEKRTYDVSFNPKD